MQTHIKRRIVILTLATIFSVAASFGDPRSLTAQDGTPVANDPVFKVTAKKSDVRIVEKFAKIIQLDKRISTVYGFDQEVISVSKVDNSPTMIRVHAQKAGVTSMVLVDENQVRYTLEVFVTGDVRHLQAFLNRLFPHSSIEAVAIGDTVVLRGWVAQPEHITQMREIAERFYTNVLDHMKVGGVQQVLLKVRVMEVQRSKIRRFGFNFTYQNSDSASAFTPGGLTPLTGLTPAVAVGGLADPTVAFSLMSDDSTFQGFLEALKEEALLKILAEPELVTTNGRPANMLAGGEFPVLVPQSLGTTTIEWRQFGVRLEAVPIILGRGRVRLELQPEVSERDLSNSVEINGIRVPALTTRRVNTQVEMRFGETFMIAGLLSTRTTASTSKIPILGELPWIGAAFRRVRYEEGETELVILVTPELVAPTHESMLPRGGVGLFTESPTDRELFIDGRLEVSRYSDRCVGCDPDPFSLSPISGPRLKGVAPLAPGTTFEPPAHTAPGLPVPPNPKAKTDGASNYDSPYPGGHSTTMNRRQRYSPQQSRASWTRPGSTRGGASRRRPGLIQPNGGFIQPASAEQSQRRSTSSRIPQ